MASQLNLDDINIYHLTDPAGMLTHLHNFPQLCNHAWRIAMAFRLPLSDYSNINKVLFLGMGGSAIAGDLVASLSPGESKVPVLVCREYDLPHWVDADTLVIASSYSGMTEETLSAFSQALESPARNLAITTGGKLKTLCQKQKVPFLSFEYSAQPRAALPFSFFISLGILQNLGIIPDKSVDVSETFSRLQNLASRIDEKVKLAQNPAKALAEKLYGRIPVFYGSGITAEAAHRWKTQVNENSKTTAFYELFSELNHNALVGYNFPEELAKQVLVVFLYSNLVHARNRLRFEITQKLLKQAKIPFEIVSGEGQSPLSQMMTLILFGDYVSYYLAILNRTDPTPVKPIDFLKEELAKI